MPDRPEVGPIPAGSIDPGSPLDPGVSSRYVVYIDMDAFYVSCELRRHPELVGRQVIVGVKPQGPSSRGVVLSASYEARALGVRSALPSLAASRLAPEAVWIPPDFERYEEAAEEVRTLLRERVGPIVPLSIDEAAFEREASSADALRDWAQGLQLEIVTRLNLPATIGASPYRVVAKIATDRAKPRGVRIVPAEETATFLEPLPVSVIPGVGPKTTSSLAEVGVHTIGDLRRAPSSKLFPILGFSAEVLRQLARGHPRPEPLTHDAPKQRSVDRTLPEDLPLWEQIEPEVRAAAEELSSSLAREHWRAAAVTVRFRWHDFAQSQRGVQLPQPSGDASVIGRTVVALAAGLWHKEQRHGGRRVRRVSVGAHGLVPVAGHQTTLDRFESPARLPR
ncbi:MAG: DNA polymerase IV [Thermoplasmata archaeon]|nr:DNA polymerase IV [Thermoplasmata archaeon]